MIDRIRMKQLAQEVGVSLSENALDAMVLYAKLMTDKNKVLNLTRVTDDEGIMIKHYQDSLSLLSAVDLKKGARLIDVGTGAGFPALPLKAARPDLDITMLDSLKKRLVFLEQAAAELGFESATIRTLHARAEDAGRDENRRESYDVATARAVARLNVLCEYCLPLVRKGGVFAAMKGPAAADELDEAERAIKLLGGKLQAIKQITLSDGSERSIIIIEKLSPTPKEYPRQSAKIAKAPL